MNVDVIFDVILKRYENSPKPNVCIFYDEDREKAIKEMQKYKKKHGFSIDEEGGTYSIAGIILRERKSTGEVILETPYIKIFDECDRRRKE